MLVELLLMLITKPIMVMLLVYLVYLQSLEVVVVLVPFHHHKVIMVTLEDQVEDVLTLIM